MSAPSTTAPATAALRAAAEDLRTRLELLLRDLERACPGPPSQPWSRPRLDLIDASCLAGTVAASEKAAAEACDCLRALLAHAEEDERVIRLRELVDTIRLPFDRHGDALAYEARRSAPREAQEATSAPGFVRFWLEGLIDALSVLEDDYVPKSTAAVAPRGDRELAPGKARTWTREALDSAAAALKVHNPDWNRATIARALGVRRQRLSDRGMVALEGAFKAEAAATSERQDRLREAAFTDPQRTNPDT